MNISIKQLSKQVILVALLSLPFSSPLEAAEYFNIDSRQKKVALGVVIGIVAAACYGYHWFTAKPAIDLTKSISLGSTDVNEQLQASGHRIYTLEQKDIELKEDDPLNILKRIKTYGKFDFAYIRCQPLEQVKIFMMCDSKDNLVGYTMIGRSCGKDEKRNLVFLIVVPNFRRQGHATTLLAHTYQMLANEGTRMAFIARQTNPACLLYDKLEGFTREDIGGGYWRYRS